MFTTYVLRSENNGSLYIGYTVDLDRRIIEHNTSQSGYTRNYKPWELVYFEEFGSKSEAIKRERFFKTGKGREYIKKKITKNIGARQRRINSA